MEFLPILDPGSLEIKGLVERQWAERNNLLHPTTLLIPVTADRLVHMQIRPARKSFPGCFDFFGGHIGFPAENLRWPINLRASIVEAAIREANEELRIYSQSGRRRFQIAARSIVQVGKFGQYKSNIEGNRERSSLFIVAIPQNCALFPADDISGKFVSVKHVAHSFDEIVAMYESQEQNSGAARGASYRENYRKYQFADGAGRILADKSKLGQLKRAIKALPSTRFANIRM